MKKRAKLVTLALAAFMFPAAALATVIDFSAVPSGCLPSYTESAVTFSATGGVTASIYGVTPNGTPGIIACSSTPFLFTRAQFSSLYSGAISVDVGDFDADSDTISLTLFNAADVALASDTFFLPASFTGMHTLTASAAGVDHALFGGVGVSGSSVYGDNFTFDGRISAVPEPATLALLGAALAGLGAARRRKQ